MSRSASVHEAVLDLPADGDARAPGGAVTLALCGSYDHDGPCPVAPHHTDVARSDGRVVVRVLFASEPGAVDAVRQRVVEALATGRLVGPDGSTTRWTLLHHGPDDVRPDERDLAERLAASP